MATENRNAEHELKTLLELVFAGAHEADEEDFTKWQHDFVFHMTDWRSDLERLCELYASPKRFSPEQAESIVQGFLYHATGHLAAAARLYGCFVDPFAPAAANQSGRVPGGDDQ